MASIKAFYRTAELLLVGCLLLAEFAVSAGKAGCHVLASRIWVPHLDVEVFGALSPKLPPVHLGGPGGEAVSLASS
ncbi:hypothetical protein GN956_G21598 [Arapaima gigas]